MGRWKCAIDQELPSRGNRAKPAKLPLTIEIFIKQVRGAKINIENAFLLAMFFCLPGPYKASPGNHLHLHYIYLVPNVDPGRYRQLSL